MFIYLSKKARAARRAAPPHGSTAGGRAEESRARPPAAPRPAPHCARRSPSRTASGSTRSRGTRTKAGSRVAATMGSSRSVGPPAGALSLAGSGRRVVSVAVRPCHRCCVRGSVASASSGARCCLPSGRPRFGRRTAPPSGNQWWGVDFARVVRGSEPRERVNEPPHTTPRHERHATAHARETRASWIAPLSRRA